LDPDRVDVGEEDVDPAGQQVGDQPHPREPDEVAVPELPLPPRALEQDRVRAAGAQQLVDLGGSHKVLFVWCTEKP
jgi:hypothetical protein